MASLTEDKIRAATNKAYKELEAFYDRVFTECKPEEAKWKEIFQLEDQLAVSLEERPLTSMQIRALMVSYTKRFKKLCLDAKDSGGVVARGGAPAS